MGYVSYAVLVDSELKFLDSYEVIISWCDRNCMFGGGHVWLKCFGNCLF